MGYELSDIEWKLNTEQLEKKFLLFHDNQVLERIFKKSPIHHNKDLELAIKSIAYQIITVDFYNFFIHELHRIKTTLAAHSIEDHPDKFGRYIYTNYTGLLKLHDPESTTIPRRVKFNSPRFMLKYKKLTLIQINYDLQTRFVTPLKKTFEEDYQSEILPHPYVYAISKNQSDKHTGNTKLQWNGPVNKLVTIFYDLTNNVLEDGQPILSASQSNLTEFIFINFNDKDGSDLSKATIRTILSPGKPDKRSPEHKKYKIPF